MNTANKTALRVCKDCVYFVGRGSKTEKHIPICAAPEHGVDPVLGQPVMPACEHQRDSDGLGRCGQSGVFFKAKASASSGPDLVPGQPVQAGTVSPPLRLTSRWYTIAAVELYSLGRGVTVVGQKGHLPRREGTLELEAGRMCFVIDPLAAEHAQGPVLTIECDVRAIIETFEAIDEVGTVELPTIECRHGPDSPHKTAILSLPSGMGKSTIALTLAKWLGCIGVVDDWYPGAPMVEGGLHLTSSTPAEWMEGGAA